MKTLKELKQELDVKLHECQSKSMDIISASQLGEESIEKIFTDELYKKEEEFYKTAHNFLSLALFTLNNKKVEVFTYPIEIVFDSSIFNTRTLQSISTIGEEGIIWLMDENGNEINDGDFTVENLATICDKVFEEINTY